MAEKTTTVLITGANRGIGLALLNSLTTKPPTTPLHIIACARSPPSASQSPIPPPKDPSSVSLRWHALDTSSPSSISSLVKDVKQHHPAGIDVLINNAGVNVDINAEPAKAVENAELTMRVNFEGTVRMMEAFLPLLSSPTSGPRPQGMQPRIVNMSSVGGKLSSGPYAPAIAHRYKTAASVSDLYGLRDDYIASVRAGSQRADGWPQGKNYAVSKALVCAATRVFARENKGVLVNCCCPGWCDSEMGGLIGSPTKTTDEGARIPLKLAFGEIGGQSGSYWENESVGDKGDGEVREWADIEG